MTSDGHDPKAMGLARHDTAPARTVVHVQTVPTPTTTHLNDPLSPKDIELMDDMGKPADFHEPSDALKNAIAALNQSEVSQDATGTVTFKPKAGQEKVIQAGLSELNMGSARLGFTRLQLSAISILKEYGLNTDRIARAGSITARKWER